MNIDYVYSMPHFVQPGETIHSEDYHIYCGGKGLNQSIAAARAGAKIIHAGMCGNGGELLLNFLNENKVDTSFVGRPDIPQGHALIQVAKSGENCIILYPGSNNAVTREYVDRVLASQKAPQYIMLQNEISEVDYIINAAYEKGFKVVLNASPIDEALLKTDLSKVEWLLVNEIEGGCFTGEEDPERIIDGLKKLSPNTGIVLTLGKKGSICAKDDLMIHQGIFEVDAVDTTAAGDTFTGYFVAALDSGLPVGEALLRATAASAISVTRPGAGPSIPFSEETEKFILERS